MLGFSLCQDQVKYITMSDGDNIVKKLWKIRLGDEKKVHAKGPDSDGMGVAETLEKPIEEHAEKVVEKPAEKQAEKEVAEDEKKKKSQRKGRDEESLGGQKKGRKGRGGNRGKGRGGNRRPGQGRGGQGRGGGRGRGGGGRGRTKRSLDEENSMEAGKLTCRSAKKILKLVRDTAPKSIKIGTAKKDGQAAYYMYPKEERNLKTKIGRALFWGR